MSETKVINQSKDRRIYRTPDGAAVSCSIQYQREYDPDDRQQPGYYGWCGLVDDQSDYVLGPYDSAEEVFAAYERRNRTHARMASVTLSQVRGPEFTSGKRTASNSGEIV